MDVVVGRIGRPHGIKGDVSVEVRTDDPEGRLAPGTAVRTDPAAAGPLTVESGRVHSGRLLLHFVGYDDRGAAERLRGILLVADVDPDERPEDPEEFYDHQLVVLAVRAADGREVLVPFVAAFVPTVDVDAGVIEVDPPPGLLDA